jgi:spermidine/putrescine transport system substrate-binding protein
MKLHAMYHRPTQYNFKPKRRTFLKQITGAATGLILVNCAPRPQKLHIYTWSNYIDEKLVERFKQETEIEATIDIFESNEDLLATLQSGKGKQYSLIYPSDYMVGQMVELKLLKELERQQVLGIDNLFPDYQSYNAADPLQRYSIPAVWGTTGLVYDSARLKPTVDDWTYLWKHQQQLTGRLTLLDDMREVFGAVLKRLGYSINTTEPAKIEAAYRELQKLKPAIAEFTTDDWQDRLVKGKSLVAMAYSADVAEVVAQNSNLKYVVPKSGATIWVDTMAIPTSAPSPEAAYAWINLMLRPDVMVEVMQRLPFSTPNRTAYQQLPPQLQADPTRYPTDSVLARCERLQPLDSAVEEIYTRYWDALKSGITITQDGRHVLSDLPQTHALKSSDGLVCRK